MDKNSIIGFVLMGLILVGFTFYQSRRFKNQAELQAQQDSIAMVESLARMAEDSALRAQNPGAYVNLDTVEQVRPASIYKDSLLETAHNSEENFYTLSNELLEVSFTTRGAQPYSANIKDYKTYSQEDLLLIKPGQFQYALSLYAGEYIKTTDFIFELAEKTDTSIAFRLCFAGGGYLEQKYWLRPGSYMLDNKVSFVGMEDVIPRNVNVVDIDYALTVPRLEKGYKNESQYSKIDYYFSGEKKPVELGRGRSASKRIDSKLSWFAFQQQFFSTIFRSKAEYASGDLTVDFLKEDDPDHNLMTCEAKMRAELDRTNPSDFSLDYEIYIGPNHFNTLKEYDQKYEKIIPLGGWLVGWFTRFVIIPLFNFFHRFIDNFGIIILLMTIVIKIVVMPLTNKSYLSSAKMSALKPELEKLNEKYPKQEDAMKKQQATMDLYKKAGISPMGGCLPTLLTFPILWAMFRFFPASIELRQQSFLWCQDLSAYDSIIDYGTRIPILGDHLSLFALLMAVTMWLYSKMTMSNQPTAGDPNAASMKFMTLWMMPIMMFFICNSLSAALSYYYLLSNLFMMLQNWILKKFFVHPEEILEKVRKAEGKPVPKSKWQLRLEEAQKMQQQQLREQQKKQGRR